MDKDEDVRRFFMIQKKDNLKKMAFFMVMVTLTLTVCLAIFLGYFTYRVYKNPFKKVNVRYLGGSYMEGDKEAGYISIKNTSVIEESEEVGSYHIYTDQRGARVNSKGEQKPANVEIITLGCSFAYGYRVENEHTFTERLGREFGVPASNFALPGYGTVQSLQMLKRNLGLKPKVVIYGFIPDHPRRNLTPCVLNNAPFCRAVSFVDFNEHKEPYIHLPRFELFDPKLFNKFEDEVLYSGGVGFKDILWRIRTDLYRFKEWKDIKYPDDPVSRKISTAYLINEMSKVAKTIDAKLIIVYLPLFGKGYAQPPPEELLASLSSDILFVDMYPKVVEYYKKENSPALTIPGDYAHPGELGHALISHELEKAIRRENLLKESISAKY
ncbi:MAG: hypothetical protein WA240_00775 [Nitrospirota bacterium]